MESRAALFKYAEHHSRGFYEANLAYSRRLSRLDSSRSAFWMRV